MSDLVSNTPDYSRSTQGLSDKPKGRRPGEKDKKARPALSPDVKLSKTLSKILRHKAAELGLHIDDEGYIKLDELLSHNHLKSHKANFEDIKRIVDSNDKQRFNMAQRPDPNTGTMSWYIRANQGHTLEVKALELKPLLSINDFPTGVAIHGTNKKAWESGIRESGLSRMQRSHIHMAIGLPGDSKVRSGMRTNSSVYIYIDIEKALKAGIPFFLSANDVILSPGNSKGYIPTEFFSKVEGL